MWPMGKKSASKARSKSEASSPSVPVFTTIVAHSGLERLGEDDAELRLWLPEPVKVALAETCKFKRMTVAKWLREFFVAHLYGEHELMRMRAFGIGIYYREQEYLDIRIPYFSVASPSPRDVLRGLGKSVHPIKLFLPQRIKDDLELAADGAQLELSPYVRSLLISRLLGHQVWAEGAGPWLTAEQAVVAAAWERGEKQPDRVPEDALTGTLGPNDVVIESGD